MSKYKTDKAKEAIALGFSKKTADLAEKLHTPFEDDEAFLREAKVLMEELGKKAFVAMVTRMESTCNLTSDVKSKPLERFLGIHKVAHFTPANLCFIGIFSFRKNVKIARKALEECKREVGKTNGRK